MKIRYVLVSPTVPGIRIDDETLEFEFDTSEAPLEQILKKLPQTALVKRWSATVLETVNPSNSPAAQASESASQAALYSSQSSESDKTDASSSLEQPSAQASQTPQPSGNQLPTELQAQALLRGIHSYITPFLEQSNGSEA